MPDSPTNSQGGPSAPGEGPQGPWGRSRAPVPLPTSRPTWLVLMTSMMLMFGAQLFFSGLSKIQALYGEPAAAESGARGSVAPPRFGGGAPEDVLVRQLAAVTIDRAHAKAMTAHAASQVLLALVLFFVVATIFAFDPKGRSAALVAGWLGIAYHVGNALFGLLVLRNGILALAPSWVEVALTQAGATSGAPALTKDELLALASTLTWVIPVGIGVLGVAFCAVFLVYFGGRRGRALYGLPPRPARLPNHDG